MNDGGPAFPHTHIIGINGMLHDTQSIGGMSLRAYFAGLAMQAAIAGRDCAFDPQKVASTSVIFADALIAALEVKP